MHIYMEKKTLTEMVDVLLDTDDNNKEAYKKIFKLVDEAPESSERDGLLAMIYHDGIGVPQDLDKSFEYAEKAAFEGGDPLGYYILGFMCDNIETPDQDDGGPRQKYDHYDAERFYEICAQKESKWKIPACNWLGDYYMNSARGGDPEIGVEYYEKIADQDAEAAGKLSDYYWDWVIPDNTADAELTCQLFKWTQVAAKLDPEVYSFPLGWLYADGIGCRESFWLAMKYFSEAFFNGDWRGASSIANMLEKRLEQQKDISEHEKCDCMEMITSWRKKADEMKETTEANEPDAAIEED